MAVIARRRSFHLNPCDQSQSSLHSQTLSSTVTPRSAGVVAASLLALAQQASIFVFTLLGGCVPTVRIAKHRRVPRALVAGASSSANIPSEARAATEVTTTVQAIDGVSAEADTISDECRPEEIQKQPEGDAAPAGVRRRKPVAVGVVDVERAGSTATARIDAQKKLPLADDASGSGLNCGEVGIPLPDATESDDVKFEPVKQEQAAADPIPLPLVAQPADSSSETANATVLRPTESETTTIIAPVPRRAHGQSAVAAAAFGFKARVGVGLGILVPSTSTGTMQLLSPFESRCASPTPEVAADADTSAPACKPHCHDHASPRHPELRADLVQRVKAFTAARLAGTHVPVSSPRRAAPTRPPLDRAGLDDPFVTPTQPRQRQHQSHSPPVPNLAFALARIRALRPAQQSPTPHQHARKGRPVLRQQTVFFKQAQTPTGTSPGTHTPAPPKPKFWAPHPAGSRSCAIAIKAPARWPPVEDKENCVVRKVPEIHPRRTSRGISVFGEISRIN
ncbi:hypothetical protein GGX14DRAFT_560572 [Mycena pura]|uniref:Uncharacterized protein n=1 Tax=Mycena pura TaxID=153505 RepID=A0AAD6VR09_9AGAR|nr:hypothetical protein GGX14DRAFT_560572 [Mycena pura]